MSFTRANPGGWVTLDQLTAAQINALDTDHANAIDGAAGGDYAPSAPIGLSNDLEIKTGATLVLESGANLTAGTIDISEDLLTLGSSVVAWRCTTATSTGTLSALHDVTSVGIIAGNITLTLPAGISGQRIRVTRNRTADAFTVTINDPSANTMGIISSSSQGWIECQRIGANWIVIGWGGVITSIRTATS